MTLTIPKRSGRLRVIGLVYGALLLLWLSLEDTNTLTVALLGAGLAILSLIFWITGRYGGKVFDQRKALMWAAISGAVTGFAAALLTALLMLVKIGLNSDDYPDYPFGMMLEMVQRSPLWSLAGIFAALGLLLAWWAFHSRREL